ncbi:Regulatory protein AtoC [bioreactor metagenome]|uniref:Regulatory protein AtoC n=1 Tax=bioreactor metagenome TaxID=1076179 RepID=A0A645CGH6_9ZZZZ
MVSTYIDLEVFRQNYSQALLSKEVTLRPNGVLPHMDLIYRSDAMSAVMDAALAVADADSAILLTGESGTGKEVVASFIHEQSKRGGHGMVAINCASLPESLLEAELFGYEKGAFTGASTAGKPGLIESAEGSTLFLDEINSMPMALQGKLLRVLETKQVKRIGSIKERTIDFRVIAATNADLASCVAKGTFRMDLYYRLNVIPLLIPPLRQRRDDIMPLCKFFLKKYFEQYGKLKILSNQAFETLKAYDWPGNVRELKNFIERLVVTGIFPDPYINNISPELFGQPYALTNQSGAAQTPGTQELRRIVNELKENQGNRAKTAEFLGISRRTLQYKLKKYKIETRLEPKVYVNSNLY